GFGSLFASDNKLIILSPKGELIIAPVSKKGYKPLTRAKVLAGKCWTVPVLANGLLYCRNADGDLVCLDLRAKK
ncbi:MAG: alcohol dehydrogenase, partial [Verrucomicrobiia bacterium]